MSDDDRLFLHAHSALLHFRYDGLVDLDVRRDDGLRVQCHAFGIDKVIAEARRLLRCEECG